MTFIVALKLVWTQAGQAADRGVPCMCTRTLWARHGTSLSRKRGAGGGAAEVMKKSEILVSITVFSLD